MERTPSSTTSNGEQPNTEGVSDINFSDEEITPDTVPALDKKQEETIRAACELMTIDELREELKDRNAIEESEAKKFNEIIEKNPDFFYTQEYETWIADQIRYHEITQIIRKALGEKEKERTQEQNNI